MSTPKTATIVFTDEESRVILQLIDAAVKSVGLNAAEAAAVLAKKFTTAYFSFESPTGISGPTGNVGSCSPEGIPSNVL